MDTDEEFIRIVLDAVEWVCSQARDYLPMEGNPTARFKKSWALNQFMYENMVSEQLSRSREDLGLFLYSPGRIPEMHIDLRYALGRLYKAVDATFKWFYDNNPQPTDDAPDDCVPEVPPGILDYLEDAAGAVRRRIHYLERSDARIMSESGADAGKISTTNDRRTGTGDEAVQSVSAASSKPEATNDEAQTIGNWTDTGNLVRFEVIGSKELKRLRDAKKAIDPNDHYIGDSLVILRVFERIKEFNKRPKDPVLILGPTGAGKTKIAELIHRSSNRGGREFFRVQPADTMASDPALVRSQWFGYGPKSGI